MNDMKALHAKLYTPTLIAAALLEAVLIVLSSIATSLKVGNVLLQGLLYFASPKYPEAMRQSNTICISTNDLHNTSIIIHKANRNSSIRESHP